MSGIGQPDAQQGSTSFEVTFNQKPKNARHLICAAITGLESDDPDENEEGQQDALTILRGLLEAFDAANPDYAD